MSRYLTDNAELRNLIINNPDLPLIFFATEDANIGDCQTEQCSISCYIDEVLDTDDTPYNDKIYTDREDLEEDIGDMLWDDFRDKYGIDWDEKSIEQEGEFNELVEKEMDKYESYWTKCIVVICE